MSASKGVLIAATGSGVGKTSIACGLLRALRRREIAVRAAKCGPDYLDPLWLARASGTECPNLDPWMAGEVGIRRLVSGAGLWIVEAAMGLYDGIRPDSDEGSGAEVARILDLPVILVVDASGSARTVAAVVQGLRDFGPARVVGVVANRVGGARHAQLVAEALDSRGLPPLVGHVAKGGLPALPERHLGLLPPQQEGDPIDGLADAIEATVDLDAVLGLAEPFRIGQPRPPCTDRLGAGLLLGLAWDEAFRFVYGPVVEALESRGVEVVRFSPLRDRALPTGLHGLWLCGGYPEVHAAELAANEGMRSDIAAFCASGRPVLAECGGLLYLATELVDQDGATHAMCGVVPACGILGRRLRALGYRTATAREDLFLAARGRELRGHEFHYGSLEGEPAGPWRAPWAWDDSRGSLGTEGWWNGSVLATWFHGWLDDDETIDRWIAAMRATRAKEDSWM